MKKPTATDYLSTERAIDIVLHRNGRVMRTHTAAGAEWFVIPAGARIKPYDAQQIIRRIDVVPSEDGLFVGHTQTWRARSASDARTITNRSLPGSFKLTNSGN